MPYYKVHVRMWNCNTKYYDGFVCPENTNVYEFIRTIIGGAEFERLEKVTFFTKEGNSCDVTPTCTISCLGMIADDKFNNFCVKLVCKAGEPHRFGMDWGVYNYL